MRVFLCFIKICAGVEQSENHNYKYMGIDALGHIIKLNPDFAEKHQLAVIDCLEACCYQIDVSLLWLSCFFFSSPFLSWCFAFALSGTDEVS